LRWSPTNFFSEGPRTVILLISAFCIVWNNRHGPLHQARLRWGLRNSLPRLASNTNIPY
jgi:hypothetical protein